MALTILTIFAVALLAFANGANDVSKGVATLAGSGRTSYRTAIAWGTLWTCLGAGASVPISFGLVNAFTSSLVGPQVLSLPTFALAVAASAAAWVIVASVTGLPVSTTHALTGAILGVAVMAGGLGVVSWWMLIAAIAAPLALSPLISAGIGYVAHPIASRLAPACVCIRQDVAIDGAASDGSVIGRAVSQVVVSACGCAAAEDTRQFVPAGTVHWGAAALLSFARGVNDNAKLAAIALLGLSVTESAVWVAFAVTAAAMTIGSYTAGLRVTRTLGERVVHMDGDTGLAAAVVAAGLVMAASFYALPVSTTHVSAGAIVGAGLRQGDRAVQWRRVRALVSAWVGTLPIAAALGAIIAWQLTSPR
jgi:PiT family inorganic phosphate transporter